MPERSEIKETHFPIADFNLQLEENLKMRIKPRRNAMSNNVSAIGHPCLRKLVYSQTVADQGTPITPYKQAGFDEGKAQEFAAIEIINALPGYKFLAQQKEFWVKDKRIHGFLDGVLHEINGRGEIVRRYAAEIKSIFNEDDLEKLNTWQDLLGRYYWRIWLVQISLAVMEIAEKEGFSDEGVLIIKPRTSKIIKIVPVPILWDLIDEIYKKAEQINNYLAAGTIPERISLAEGLCNKCEYNAICSPSFSIQDGKYLDDPKLAGMIRDMLRLDASRLECNRLGDQVKSLLKAVQFSSLIVGEFSVTKKISAKGSQSFDFSKIMEQDEAEKLAAERSAAGL